MNRRLIYVVGPSGAGKDSVLSWLRKRTPNSAPVHWAQRTIDRPHSNEPDAENHAVVNSLEFEQLLTDGQFAMHWDANTHRYGIRKTELTWLNDSTSCVFVNGSRAHLPVAALDYPALTLVHITACDDVLRQRLIARGRESVDAVNARLQRQISLTVPTGCGFIEISNNTTLDEAGRQLLMKLRAAGLWPVN